MTPKVEFILPNVIYINDGEYIGFCSIELVHAAEYILEKTKHVLTFPKFTDLILGFQVTLLSRIILGGINHD